MLYILVVICKYRVGYTLNLSEYKGVMVFAEQRDGEIQKVSLELLGEGRRLADELKTDLTAIFLGYNIRDKAKELIYYGADKVVVADHEILETYMGIVGDLHKVVPAVIEELKKAKKEA